MKRWRWLLLPAILVPVAGFAAYWGHFMGFRPWQPVAGKITVDGARADGELYRSPEGRMAVRFTQPSLAFTVYTYDQGQPTRMMAGGQYFTKSFGKLWFKPDGAVGMDMMPGGSVKIETDPHVIASPGHLEFTTCENQRVAVDY